MKANVLPVGTHFLHITENDNTMGVVARHINNLISYLDDHGLAIEDMDMLSADKHQAVIAYSAENNDNEIYYAAKTYLAEQGIDHSYYHLETTASNPLANA
ncbi:hypothetical protein [Prevotella sp. HUN102]|uniref:hypothetical protein n=1 Tax=Prevotella sp. HUN102 TaxID=1392486 RepID=UPI0004919D7F|nr:hypothetical protein [Prevotella sp. HUN102]